MKRKILATISIVVFMLINIYSFNVSKINSNGDVELENLLAITNSQAENTSICCALVSPMHCKTQIYPYYQDFYGWPIWC